MPGQSLSEFRSLNKRPPTEGELDKWRINNDNHEVDLVSILCVPEAILQTETKSSKKETKTKQRRVAEGIKQVEFFKEYLIRMHGSAVNNVVFTPIIAFPNLKTLPSKSQCYCRNSLERLLRRGAEYKSASTFAVNKDDQARGAWCSDKLYAACPSTIQGEGCLFFKWEDEYSPSLQTANTGSNSCSCDREPLTIRVPQPRPNAAAKRFQVCKDNQCDYFAWVDEPDREGNQQIIDEAQRGSVSVFNDGSCKRHFMFAQHTENETERNEWWTKNCPQPTANNASDTLRNRLIITSSMVFTRIPRLLSRLTPNSQLILMRYI